MSDTVDAALPLSSAVRLRPYRSAKDVNAATPHPWAQPSVRLILAGISGAAAKELLHGR